MKKGLLVKIFVFIAIVSVIGGYIFINSDKKIQRQIREVLGLSTDRSTNLTSESQSLEEKYKGWETYKLELPDKSKIELMYPNGWKVSEVSDLENINVTISDSEKSQFRYIFLKNQIENTLCPKEAITEIVGLNNKYLRYIDKTYYTNENWYICEYSLENSQYKISFNDYFSYYNATQSNLDTMDKILSSVKRSSV